MLFNSFEFLLLFLPVTLAGFYLLGRVRPLQAAAWLALASLVFYAMLIPVYTGLLLISIALNFQVGKAIAAATGRGDTVQRRRLLWLGLGGNLAALCYYKYANFFLDTLHTLTGSGLTVAQIVLPLGISFFTFTQIAFLVDTSRGKASEPSFVHYLLFVTYFPHLIAGPILHHAEMMPQFARRETYRFDAANMAVGLSIFAVGLFKKVVLADGVAVHATPVFTAAAGGATPDFQTAWTGALCYTLQLYFDFSGYSDMAIGLSRLFGVTLPLNFDSPYKATSIIDFWRRWHMTLSRFLRDYLYIPMGGSRHGLGRRILNVMVTMLLGGLWHGAGWTFVVWGALHGAYLAVNHAWVALRERMGWVPGRLGTLLAGALTFLCVVVGWVFFRAADFDTAGRMLRGMASLQTAAFAWPTLLTLPHETLNLLHWRLPPLLNAVGVQFGTYQIHAAGWMLVLLPAVWLMPNTQQLFRHHRPALGLEISPPAHGAQAARMPAWRPSLGFAVGCGLLTLLSLINMNRISEFLYFQF